jgi:hypothetical protein
METEQTNDAYEYALLIKRELLALETLLENWGDIAAAVPDDLADMDGQGVGDIIDALAELGIEWPENDGIDVISTYLNETCLELTVLRAVNGDLYEPARERVEILRTCGGPRCDITRDTNDGDMVQISVNSGGDASTIRVSVGTLAAALDELAGCY